jgi:hypothetical protein
MDNAAKISQLDPDLSRRLHRALTAGEEELFQVLLDGSYEVLRVALKNPSLQENHLVELLGRRDLPEEFLKTVNGLSMVSKSHRLKVALVHNPNTPGPVVLSILPHLYLFELLDVCYLPGATPDQRFAAERAIIQRLPTTPLGNKITLARRGTSVIVEALLKEGDTRLMEACLGNPHLKEVSIFQFLNGATSTPETISMVARNPKWGSRQNLQLAILKNSRTPGVWFTLFLPRLSGNDIKGIIASRKINTAQKKLVNEELRRRGM